MSANHFDAAAATWDENPVRRAMQDAVHAALRAAIPFHPAMDVLEYGCGTAAQAIALAPDVRHVIAADTSAGMLDVARAKVRARGLPNVQVLELNLETTEPEAACVDCVVTVMATHHIGPVNTVLARWARMLRPEGWLALVDLFAEDGSFHGPEQPVPHNGFDPHALADDLAAAGFTDCAWKEVHRVHKPVGDRMGDFPLFLLTARRARL